MSRTQEQIQAAAAELSAQVRDMRYESGFVCTDPAAVERAVRVLESDMAWDINMRAIICSSSLKDPL